LIEVLGLLGFRIYFV